VKQESRNLVKYRLKRARETLLDAQKYFKDATLNSTVNRIYYAMFYAVNGLLISKELSSSKHSGVRALFNKEFINKGTVEKNWGKFYSEMFNNRQEGDYADYTEFKREDVEKWLSKAEEFVKRIEEITLGILERT